MRRHNGLTRCATSNYRPHKLSRGIVLGFSFIGGLLGTAPTVWGAVWQAPPAQTAKQAVGDAAQDDSKYQKLIEKAAEHAVGKQRYRLQYRFSADNVWRFRVEHTTSTRTHVAGQTETSSTRSNSVKRLSVARANGEQYVLENVIESASMWRQIGDAEPMMYDSAIATGAVPPEFAQVHRDIGKVVSTVTVNTQGAILGRRADQPQAPLGVGELFMPLPETDVPVGHQWYVLSQFPVKDDEGRLQRLELRILYELEKVVDGRAYISHRTQVMTPVHSERVRSQLMQKINNGYLVLDLARGIPVYKEFEWNSKVQGYQGPDSYLQYLSRMTETWIAPETESHKAAAVAASHENVLRPRPVSENKAASREAVHAATASENTHTGMPAGKFPVNGSKSVSSPNQAGWFSYRLNPQADQ